MKPPLPRLRYCHLNNEYSATCSNPLAAIPRNRTKPDRALFLSPSLFTTNNGDSLKKTIKTAVATVHVNDVPQYYIVQK